MNRQRREKPGRQARELLNQGIFWLERGEREPALDALVSCYRLGYRRREVWQIIREQYCSLHQERYRNNYLRNVEGLRSRPGLACRSFPRFEQLRYRFLPYSPTRLAVYDRVDRCFLGDIRREPATYLDAVKERGLIILNNELLPWNIIACEDKSREIRPYLWMKIPLYLFYDNFEEFVRYLPLDDLTPALSTGRLVFFFGEEELDRYFDDSQALLPSLLLNAREPDADRIVSRVAEKHHRSQERVDALRRGVDDFYAGISRQSMLERLQNGKPRILFITSRFTTALQYYIRDCALACDHLGIPNLVLKERSDLHRVNLWTWSEALHDFQPDIIFCADHFRWEQPFVPDQIIYLTWVQDLLPNIVSRESAVRIGRQDFLLNVFISDVEMLCQLGYPDEAIIEAPFAVNDHLYRRQSLKRTERELYRADIGAFSNAGNPAAGLAEILRRYSGCAHYDTLELALKAAYRNMYRGFYLEEIFYSLDDYRSFLSGRLDAHGLSLADSDLQRLALSWREEVGYRLLRSLPIEWLHEQGYDLKLWGREWSSHPLLAVHAQGVADNGETLSRIINACKIIVGSSPCVTAHPRVFETLLSGSLYLAYQIPERFDMGNIRNYLAEGREIVFAYNRTDLYQKVDYYLSHELERRKIITRARRKITKNLTYEALMKRVIAEVAQRFEGRGEWSMESGQ
jgi:hypothetical protein